MRLAKTLGFRTYAQCASRTCRVRRPVPIGPSFKKLVLDLVMIVWTLGLLIRHRYRIVHAHEESVFWCRVLKPFFRFRLIYDMHSSLPQQLTNFKFTKSSLLIGTFRWLEDWSLRASDAVITICPDLRDYALSRGIDPAKHLLIENSIFDAVMLERDATPAPGSAAAPAPEYPWPRIRRSFCMQARSRRIRASTFSSMHLLKSPGRTSG